MQLQTVKNFDILYTLTLTYDLDLDPMAFIYEADLDIVKIYPHGKNEVSRSRHSKVTAQCLKFDLDL